MKKYELTNNKKIIYENILYQIRALRDFSDVKAGDLGGYVQSENNLNHNGDCWVYDDAQVLNNARVFDNAWIFGYAEISENASIFGNAHISGYVKVLGNSKIFNNATVCDFSSIHDNVEIYGNSKVGGYSSIYNNVKIFNNATVNGFSIIDDNAIIHGDVKISEYINISKNADISKCGDYVIINNFGINSHTLTAYKTQNNSIFVFSHNIDSKYHFTGTLDEFKNKTQEIHKDTKYEKTYELIIQLIEAHFKIQ